MNRMRYKRGDTKPVFVAMETAQTCEAGDLAFLHPTSGQPRRAGAMTDQGSEALNQDAFQQYFLGVFMGQSRSGDTAKVEIATAGEFDFDCDSATFGLGALVAACENSDGDALEDQKVVEVAVGSESKAIARVAKRYAAAVTTVLVRICSTIMDGGVQPQVAGSSSGAV